MPRQRRAGRLLLLLAIVLGAPVAASSDGAAPDVAAFESFVDGVMAAQFEELDLVGAVVTVVQVGRPTFSKGYGFADLDLHVDVNAYLRTVQVPDTYPEPVTLAHLMAHTAGFEDRSVGLFARTSDAVQPLEDLVADGLPARVRPVGEAAAYSNHGAALAGRIVEEVSGLTWNDYLEARILAPLGMTRSTGEQPVPAALEGDLAVGYDAVGGTFARRSFGYAPLAPTGSMSATGHDMARFMLAHLQGGAHDGGSVLRSETVEAMHRTHATQDPRLSGSTWRSRSASRRCCRSC